MGTPRTPRLTNAYIKERDELLKEGVEVLDPTEDKEKALSNPHPSKEFCERFYNRIDRGNFLAQREYGGRDAEDYHTWGYALYGDVNMDGEGEVNDLYLWEWLLHYGLI